MIRTALLLSALLLLSCASPHAQLGRRIDRILATTDARVGVAVIAPDGECLVRCDTMLPMLSVFKFPAAVALLDKTARERTSLTTPVRIGPEWLDRNTYSPLRDSLPTTGGTLTLTDLLRYSISQSDNIACDILLELAGGPAGVDAYLRSRGIDGIRIVASERTMHLATENQRLNTARPAAVCALFDRLLRGELLPPEETALLRRLLEECETGREKLRAGLPAGTTLGHKTGSSDRTAEGIRLADNDAGYVLLPDGRSYCIAVFVTDSREDDAANAAVAAEVSRAAYECFIGK